MRELELYAPLVTSCYLVVCDTLIETMPEGSFQIVLGAGNNPATAVSALASTDRFEVAIEIDAKLQISVAPGGYLKCVVD